MSTLYYGFKIYKKFTDDEMVVYAASASFWMLISALPFLMLLITAVQLVPGLSKEDLVSMLLSATPDIPQFESLIYGLADNVYVEAPATVISLSALASVWTSSSGVFNIDKGLRKIAGTPSQGNYIRRRLASVFYTLIFILLFILTLVFLVLGSAIADILTGHFAFLSDIVDHILGLRTIIAVAVLFITFTFIYAFMSGKRGPIKLHLGGALFASVGWIGVSYAFSIYFTYIRNLSYMYGSLGALILLMFWVFAIICVIFMGAELNYFSGKAQK